MSIIPEGEPGRELQYNPGAEPTLKGMLGVDRGAEGVKDAESEAGMKVVRLAPPTVQGRVYVPGRGRGSSLEWIGVLCLVLGVGGIALGGFTLFTREWGTRWVRGMATGGEELAALTEWYKWPTIAVVVIYIGVQLYLCYVAMLLLRRRAGHAKHARLFAWLKIGVAIVMLVVYGAAQFETTAMMLKLNMVISQPLWLAYAGIVVQLGIGLLWTVSLPVFLLVWFRKRTGGDGVMTG